MTEMSTPYGESTPIYDAVAASLAECPLSGPIDPQREPELFEDVAAPILSDGEERS